MIRVASVVLAVLALLAPAGAAGVTERQIDDWLSSSPQIVHSTVRWFGRERVRVKVEGANGGYASTSGARTGVLANGQPVMILMLPSGGSGGVFTTLLFTKLGGRTRFVGYIPSPNGRLDVSVQRGSLLIQTPVYGMGDGNCCPSKQHFERATLHGIRLVTQGAWTVPSAQVIEH